jgi:hypothetical protein
MTRRLVPILTLLSLLESPGFHGRAAIGAGVETHVALFDGKSLDGWKTVNGGATYHVESGEIVGVVDPASKRNTFLRTERTYRNFRLELDAKLDIPGNSGIQFRSHQKPGENGQVFGYQCEIDPSPRAWTAGIYDEGRRGWLFPLEGRPEARKAYRPGEWNHFVIEARGPAIKTWLNGILCADLIDTADDEGFIALQVHAGKEGRIRWKNVALIEYPDTSYKPLWDGKTLHGWNPSGGGKWEVEGGTIHGTSTTAEKAHGHLFTDTSHGDFALKLKFKPIKGDSGVYLRAEEGGKSGVKGLQANIDPEKDTGGLYEIDGRGWLARPKAEDIKKVLKPNAWNELTVVARGGRIVVHVNGAKTAEVVDPTGPRQGRIALQVHAGQDVDVRFKDIEVLPLNPERAAQ